LPILFPQQLQRQMAMLLQLLMHGLPVRLRPHRQRSRRRRPVPKQLGFQLFFAQISGQRPADSGRLRSLQIIVNRAHPDPATARDGSLA
jgi:hypothetical protein